MKRSNRRKKKHALRQRRQGNLRKKLQATSSPRTHQAKKCQKRFQKAADKQHGQRGWSKDKKAHRIVLTLAAQTESGESG